MLILFFLGWGGERLVHCIMEKKARRPEITGRENYAAQKNFQHHGDRPPHHTRWLPDHLVFTGQARRGGMKREWEIATKPMPRPADAPAPRPQHSPAADAPLPHPRCAGLPPVVPLPPSSGAVQGIQPGASATAGIWLLEPARSSPLPLANSLSVHAQQYRARPQLAKPPLAVLRPLLPGQPDQKFPSAMETRKGQPRHRRWPVLLLVNSQ